MLSLQARQLVYVSLVDTLKRKIDEDAGAMTIEDLVCIVGQMGGFCIGMCAPEFRAEMRGNFITEMDNTLGIAGD